MAGRKLMDLKVTELKRELEERERGTTGRKEELRLRLQEALREEGEDPDTYNFVDDMSVLLDQKLREQSENIDGKLQEHSRSLDEKLTHIDEKLQEHSRSLDKKFQEQSGSLDEKLQENSRNIDEKLQEQFRRWDEKCQSLQEQIEAMKGNNQITKSEVPPTTIDTKPDWNTERVAVPLFDGKTSWEEHKVLFDTIASANNWADSKKAYMLSTSLRGDALQILQMIPKEHRQDFGGLMERLETRYGQEHLLQVFRSQFKSRYQKQNETLQEFSADVLRLIRLAYPSLADDVYENLAADKFVDGLRDNETQQHVRIARPKTMNEALSAALEIEAVKQAGKGNARDRKSVV